MPPDDAVKRFVASIPSPAAVSAVAVPVEVAGWLICTLVSPRTASTVVPAGMPVPVIASPITMSRVLTTFVRMSLPEARSPVIAMDTRPFPTTPPSTAVIVAEPESPPAMPSGCSPLK